ncbi:MAG: hypothetical protein WC313_12285 [Candidatus Kapaibacterium sp.]
MEYFVLTSAQGKIRRTIYNFDSLRNTMQESRYKLPPHHHLNGLDARCRVILNTADLGAVSLVKGR